jgi:hypothetical protein
MCTGMTSEGDPLGTVEMVPRPLNPFKTHSILVWQSGSWARLMEGSILTQLFGKNRLGYVGNFDFNTLAEVKLNGSYHLSSVSAAAAVRNGVILGMEYFKNCQGTALTAWNGEGTTMAGFIISQGAQQHVIWREGKIIDKLMDGKKRADVCMTVLTPKAPRLSGIRDI